MRYSFSDRLYRPPILRLYYCPEALERKGEEENTPPMAYVSTLAYLLASAQMLLRMLLSCYLTDGGHADQSSHSIFRTLCGRI